MVLVGSYQAFLKTTMGVRIAMPCLIVVLTALRLYIRGRRGWKWDDGFVSFGCFWIVVNLSMAIALQIHPLEQSEDVQFASFIIMLTAGMGAVWAARMSIFQTIARITPDLQERKRRQMLSIGYVVLGLFELSQVFWSCIPNSGWDEASQTPACVCRKQIPTFHLVSSIISDAPLVILPLVTIRSLKKSAPRIHTRLSLVFLAALCTTSLSIAGPLVALVDVKFEAVYIILFEMYASLLVCNLPVLAAAVGHMLCIKNISRDKTLPPIEFAAAPRSYGESAELSRPPPSSSSSLPGIGGTVIMPAPLSRSPESSELPGIGDSFVGRLRSFTTSFADEEAACEAEANRIRQGVQGVLNAEKALKDHA